MKLIYKIFRQDPDSREGVIAVTSNIGIAVNLAMAAVKVALGVLTSSIAIVTEGANNATDALSSVLTLIGTKLAGKHPDKKHPFGYRRIEYLTGLVVALLILVTGIEMLIGAVRLIFQPEELHVSYPALIIIAVSAVIKFFLGVYTIKMGRQTGSSALEGVGLESRNDSFASVITIASTLIFLVFGISVDAYAGIIISAIIIKAGIDVLKVTLAELIGRPGEKELADKLYKEIRGTEGILGASDMMLHNYGPDTWSGSVNLEIEHNKTVGEVYQLFHELQLNILQKYAVIMIFGIYAVDNNNEKIKAIRKSIGVFLQDHKYIESCHAVYLEPKTEKLYCDFVVDYALKDWEKLRKEFVGFIKKRYPCYEVELTIETEYV